MPVPRCHADARADTKPERVSNVEPIAEPVVLAQLDPKFIAVDLALGVAVCVAFNEPELFAERQSVKIAIGVAVGLAQCISEREPNRTAVRASAVLSRRDI